MPTLTPEQSDWYLERFGERYVAVQDNPLRPSRRVRRALRYGGRNSVTSTDAALFDVQKKTIDQLRAH